MKVKNVGHRPITLFGVDIKPGETAEVNASKKAILMTGLTVEIEERKKKFEVRKTKTKGGKK